MKKKLITGISAVSIILLTLFSASCATTKTEKDNSVNYVQIKDESDKIVSDISYPEIKELDLLNNAIEQYVAEEWEQIKEDSEKSERPFEYIVSSEIFSSGSIKSVLLNVYEYRGGANGETKLKSFVFDAKNNKFLDITQASGYTVEELSDISRDSLNKSKINSMEEMILSGTAPSIESFRNFVLDGNKLVIYFEPAVVAPHSEGIQTVSVNLKK